MSDIRPRLDQHNQSLRQACIFLSTEECEYLSEAASAYVCALNAGQSGTSVLIMAASKLLAAAKQAKYENQRLHHTKRTAKNNIAVLVTASEPNQLDLIDHIKGKTTP